MVLYNGKKQKNILKYYEIYQNFNRKIIKNKQLCFTDNLKVLSDFNK